jgi:putative ABC transport system permease protein
VFRLMRRGLMTRKLRTILTSIAIVLGVAMVSGTFVLTDQIDAAFDDIFSTALAGTDVVVSKQEAFQSDFQQAGPLDASVLETVRGVDGVRKAEGSIEASGQLVVDGDVKGSVGGAPSFVFSHASEPFSPNRIIEGRFPERSGEIAIGTGLADDANVGVGDHVGLNTRQGEKPVTVVGTFKFGDVSSIGGASLIEVTLADAQRWFDREGQFSTISVQADEGVSQVDLKRRIEAAVPGDVKVQTRAEAFDEQSRETTDAINGFLGPALLAFAGVSVFVGAFIIFNTFSITVAQRAREFAMLRTVGASRRQILQAVVGEALVIGVLASILGILGGYAFAWLVTKLFDAVGFGLPATGLPISATGIIAASIVGVLVTVVASFVPAIRATRVPPIAALREGATLPRGRFARYSWVLAALFGVLGGLLIASGLTSDGDAQQALLSLAAGALLEFIAVAMVAKYLVRPLAGGLGWPLEKLFGSTGRLARGNTVRNPSRTAVTAAALMIGVGLVVFVAVFAQGLKVSFTDAIQGSLQSDVVVSPSNFASDGTLPPGVRTAIEGAPGVEASTAFGSTELKLDNGGVEFVTAIDPKTYGEIYDFDWIEGDDSLLAGLGADGALLERGFADSKGLAVGDSFGVLGPSGARATFRVDGIYRDPVLATGFLIPFETYEKLAIEPAYDLAFARARPGVSAEQLKASIEKAVASYPTAKTQTTQEFNDEISGQVDQILFLLYALLAMSVIISLFGIVNTLALSVFERTREIGMLRAIGTTRRQIRRMIRYESVITCLIGAMIGIVVGVAFGYVMTKALEDDGLTFSVPWTQLVIFLVVSAVAGVFAAILPARRASRLNVLEALHYE